MEPNQNAAPGQVYAVAPPPSYAYTPPYTVAAPGQQPFAGAYPNPQANFAYPAPASATVPMAAMNRPAAAPMPIPASIPGCPSGLEYLSVIDQLLVHQQVEIMEVLTGFETNNKYAIKNALGQLVYFAVEDTDCCTRNCCGPGRPFDIKILDNSGREVMHVQRPFRCYYNCCGCICCLQELSVFAPPGTLIGKVRQNCSCCKPFFTIKDANDESVLHIRGPCVASQCCSDVEFKVLSRDETAQCGMITRQWGGMARELYTDADNFGVTFPMDMSVTAKATMLGAVFLIDFMFYETSDNNN